MPAPQQARVPIYDASWKPRAIMAAYKDRMSYVRFKESDTPGFALARLLGVVTDAMMTYAGRPQTEPAGPVPQPWEGTGVPPEHRERMRQVWETEEMVKRMKREAAAQKTDNPTPEALARRDAWEMYRGG